MPVKLRPHQEKAVENMHNGCVLCGGVGVGKTITSLGYYFTKVCGGTINQWGSMTTPKDLYVITTAKVRDSKAFEIQAAQYGVTTDPSMSTNGVKITVDSWNNLKNYTEVKDAFFVFDEQRVVGYGAWSRAFIKVARNNEWVLCSATPGDTWLDYIPVFIANGWYRNKTDFLDQHVIWTPRIKYPKVLRYQNVGVLVRRRNDVLVHMPYERHTVRHLVNIDVDYDKDLFDKVVKKKWHVYENRPLRDAAELFGVMRKVVNSDSSRLEAIKDLLQKHPRLIVFYNFDYELEMLRSLGKSLCLETSPSTLESQGSTSWDYLLRPEGVAANEQLSSKPTESSMSAKHSSPSTSSTSTDTTASAEPGTAQTPSQTLREKDAVAPAVVSDFAIAEWNGHKHQEIPATERWMYLVQYRAGAEGWNCVETDAMVFYSQTYSYRDWWQAHGRIDRINTPFTDLYYYNLVSRSVIDKAIRAALKVKKNFNERDLRI